MIRQDVRSNPGTQMPLGEAAATTMAETTIWMATRRLTAGRILTRCHAFIGKFFDCLCVFGKVRQPHSAQHVRRFGKLDVVVADDLEAIAPGVAEVEERAGHHLDAGLE